MKRSKTLNGFLVGYETKSYASDRFFLNFGNLVMK
ncbi:MAG: hypothetical protein K0S31_2627 [Sphingobacterium multivorum]|jgi:hypothetical protein|nr:hypothetical protein [Sphingobacterium multivorum]